VARFSPSPDTFVVEEIPAYLPTGTGEHTYVWIEKRLATTLDVVNDMARRLGIEAREIGYAGMKDRHATTRQWLSIPRVDPDTALAAGDDRLRVLCALRHGNKLRIGHLRGNRFEVVVTDLDDETEARSLGERLAERARLGLPNRYGDQRFGMHADNARRGIAVLRGEQRERDHRRRRLLLSAVQSAVFNQVLAVREEEGLLRRVLTGDILQKTDSGGLFVTDAPLTDQVRLDAGEIVVTGPMPGGWAPAPPPETEARAIEDRALATVGVTRAELASVGRDLPGTRRPLLVPVTLTEPAVLPVVRDGGQDGGDDGVQEGGRDGHAVRLRFELPAGSYATVLLEAIGVTVDTRRP
jgi:tRNA pseudouridine13 synthase